MIGSAVHTTNPMHHPLRRSELCNRIHHKHRWEGDDDHKYIDANYDDDDKYIDAYYDDYDNHVFESSELHHKQQRDVDDDDICNDVNYDYDDNNVNDNGVGVLADSLHQVGPRDSMKMMTSQTPVG